jgi:hypothetical protein
MIVSRGWMVAVVLVSASALVGVQATDPVGDLLDPTPPAFDLVQYSTSFGPGTLTITLTFDSVVAADLEWLGGFIDFDTDQDISTGIPSHLEIYDVQPFPPFGMDYWLEFLPLTGEAELSTISGQDIVSVGRYPVTIDGATVTVVLPRCHTDPCTGIVMGARFDTLILLQGTAGFADRAPNDDSVIRATPAPADLDEDGDVDLDDYTVFSTCVTGANTGPVASECRSADLDTDEDVDQTDFGLLQGAFTGPY